MRRLLAFLALLAAVLGVVVLVLTRRDREETDSRLALRMELLERQVRGAERLLAAARSGPLLRFEDVLVTMNEELAQEIVSTDKIRRLLERLVAKGFKVKVPTKLIPVLDLPAGLTEEVVVGARRVRLETKPRALWITPEAMWYGAEVEAKAERMIGVERPAGTGGLRSWLGGPPT
jgi:hypothetical protein